jgi:hypothetical protein
MIICGLIGEKRVSAAWEAKQVSAYAGRFVMFSLLVSHVDVVATGHYYLDFSIFTDLDVCCAYGPFLHLYFLCHREVKPVFSIVFVHFYL